LFLAMQTQWRFAGFGQRVGLDYAMIEATARLSGIDIEPREPLFVWLREMERTALDTFAAKARAESRR